MDRKADIAVFGASGFTGRFIVEELLRHGGDGLRVIAAGRNAARVRTALESHSAYLQKAVKDGRLVDIIVADATDEASLLKLAKSCKVLIAAAGPFARFGLPVVAACIKAKTRYVDITGEPLFFERSWHEHHEDALAANVSVVHCCGFDCVPTDLSVDAILKRVPNASLIEGFLSSNAVGANTGTLISAIEGYRNAPQLRLLRKEMARPKLPSSKFRPKNMFFEKRLERYCLQFPGADSSILRTSQVERLEERKPVDFALYFSFKQWYVFLAVLWVGLLITLAARFKWVDRAVRAYPTALTLGIFSANPDPHSFGDMFAEWNFLVSSEDGRRHTARFRMPDPGYGGTSILVVACALQMLQTPEIPAGVVTPATAFGSTSLMSHLKSRGIEFEITEKK